jgi:hypothetical protein
MADTPQAASVKGESPGAAVTDHRPVPRGVLPRGVQTWVMAGVAVFMLAIMLIVGRPEPPARPVQTTAPVQPPSADRVRDYQERLRLLEAQAMRDAQTAAPAPGVQPIQYDDAQPPPPQDPIAADRKRREYESLFASNVVLSRRPENERPDIGRNTTQSATPPRSDSASPSVDEVADAVVRASARTAGLAATSPRALARSRTCASGRPKRSIEDNA